MQKILQLPNCAQHTADNLVSEVKRKGLADDCSCAVLRIVAQPETWGCGDDNSGSTNSTCGSTSCPLHICCSNICGNTNHGDYSKSRENSGEHISESSNGSIKGLIEPFLKARMRDTD